jgi:hypothetical protein
MASRFKTWKSEITIGGARNRSEKSVRTRAKWSQNDGHHTRNTYEQESKETMENYGQEEVQAEFGVDMLLTRNENKKMGGLRVCSNNNVFHWWI